MMDILVIWVIFYSYHVFQAWGDETSTIPCSANRKDLGVDGREEPLNNWIGLAEESTELVYSVATQMSTEISDDPQDSESSDTIQLDDDVIKQIEREESVKSVAKKEEMNKLLYEAGTSKSQRVSATISEDQESSKDELLLLKRQLDSLSLELRRYDYLNVLRVKGVPTHEAGPCNGFDDEISPFCGISRRQAVANNEAIDVNACNRVIEINSELRRILGEIDRVRTREPNCKGPGNFQKDA
ncbi:hypothetical protein QAD02_000241 [Eretmocerus hayati]|uniref:Uncharacterized protein n=1 Tax=Eretmocerus hayati TaxID=131215 RepID=A0ACC2NFF1_9HYME|nr:hypothetical protein QAD02_000241 [Eretmocerus hayati]